MPMQIDSQLAKVHDEHAQQLEDASNKLLKDVDSNKPLMDKTAAEREAQVKVLEDDLKKTQQRNCRRNVTTPKS